MNRNINLNVASYLTSTGICLPCKNSYSLDEIMPRQALYDLHDVLNNATDVFIEHGYHGAIMEELIARTGFNRRGFYIEFGSKQAFFYRVIDFYQQEKLAPVVAHIDKNQGLMSIQHFFSDYVELIAGRGCLLINAITELGFDDQHIQSVGRHYLDQLQISFIGCLEKAMQHGQVRSDINVEAVALQLTSYVQGFAVNAILSSGREELDIATQALIGPLQIK